MKQEKYIFFTWKPRLTRKGAYCYFGVKQNSYASRIVDRFFDYFILGAKSLWWEYLRFYSKEFPSYQCFLKTKFNLTDSEAASLNSINACYKEIHKSPDVYISNMLEDEDLNLLISQYLGGD